MKARFPGYDVLAKRDSPSWNARTREVVDERLSIAPDAHAFCDEAQWATLQALCERIVPQAPDKPGRIPVAALVDATLHEGAPEGYRDARMPALQEAWRRGLRALDAEARARQGADFHVLPAARQDDLLRGVQAGNVVATEWQDLPAMLFFTQRVLHDILGAYYGHPTAWNEIGFGGPASPRGYARLGFDRHDPWEAEEAPEARASEGEGGRSG